MGNSNENQQSKPFYSYRGVNKCLSDGISFLTDNFTHIVKQSLPLALALSALQACVIFVVSDSKLLKMMLGQVAFEPSFFYWMGGLLLVMLLLYVAVAIVFQCYILRLIVIHSHNLPIKRFAAIPTYKISAKYGLKFLGFLAAFCAMFVFVAALCVAPLFIKTEGTALMVTKVGVSMAMYIVLLVCVLPLQISICSIFLRKGKMWENAWYGYKMGFKVWGKLFCLFLLIGILVMSVMYVLSMPATIMVNAYYAATFSQMSGDAIHLPAGFQFWYFVVLLLTSYLYTFTFWVRSVPYAYMYAAVKSDEKEEAKNSYLKNF